MKRLLVAVVVSVLPALGFAQTLADKVPANSVVYVGFKGSRALDAQYQQSHLKPILDGTDLSVLVSDGFHERLANVIARKDEQLAENWPAIITAGKEMWQYPTAVTVYAQANGDPAVAVVCEAGNDAAALLEKIKPAIPPATAIQLKQAGKYVLLTNSVAELVPLLADGAAPSLANTPTFSDAMKQVSASGAVVAFVNIDGWFDVMAKHEPQIGQQRGSLGLNGIHGAAISGDFAGKDWSTRAFIASVAPREGLASLLEGPTISGQAMKIIPQTAMSATICQADLASMLTRARAMLTKVEPSSVTEMDRGLGMANAALGMDIEKQLLPPLGTEWIVYTDANIGGTQFMGMVLANRLRDPAKAEAALLQLQQKLLTVARAGAETKGLRIPLAEKQFNGTTIRTISLPLVAPSWAIRDGVLYVGLFPQVVESAASFTASGKPGIDQVPALAARLKSGNMPQSLSYNDMSQSISAGYGLGLLFSRYAGFLDLMTGVQTPSMLIPPLPVLRENSAATLATTWTDAAGWHMQSSSPFPGARPLATLMASDISTLQAPIVASIAIPAFARAREKAVQVKCASNMRQIGQGLMLFANQHKGKYPDTLSELTVAEQMAAETFVCPSTGADVSHVRGAQPEERRAWINDNSSYIYLGKGLTMGGNPGRAVLYEEPSNHGGEGANVLFADGHVEFVTPRRLGQLIGDANNP